MSERAYADPRHPGNRIRTKVYCLGCGKRGCITYWGDWCYPCNVERMDRISGKFDRARQALDHGDLDEE